MSVAQNFARLSVALDIRPIVDAMSRMRDELLRMDWPSLRRLNRAVARMQEREAARQHRPVPLRINGHEYRRRSRKR